MRDEKKLLSTQRGSMLKKFILALIFTVFLTSIVYAHEFWIEKRGDDYVPLYGHGDDTEAYNSDWFKRAQGRDIKGKALRINVIKKKDKVVMSCKQ
jgi:uncharacterized GH25 family protein